MALELRNAPHHVPHGLCTQIKAWRLQAGGTKETIKLMWTQRKVGEGLLHITTFVCLSKLKKNEVHENLESLTSSASPSGIIWTGLVTDLASLQGMRSSTWRIKKTKERCILNIAYSFGPPEQDPDWSLAESQDAQRAGALCVKRLRDLGCSACRKGIPSSFAVPTWGLSQWSNHSLHRLAFWTRAEEVKLKYEMFRLDIRKTFWPYWQSSTGTGVQKRTALCVPKGLSSLTG